MTVTTYGPPAGIGGDPGAVEAAARDVASGAATMDEAGQHVRNHADQLVEGWAGSAADAAHTAIRRLGERTELGAEVVGRLPKVLEDYASELRAAQQAHATAVQQAVAARQGLANVRAMLATYDDVNARSAAARGFAGSAAPSQESAAVEAVEAATAAIGAAVAREQQADEAAARAVRGLTEELAGMTLDVAEAGAASGAGTTNRDGERLGDGIAEERTTAEVMERLYSGNVLDLDLSDPQAFDPEDLRSSGAGAGDRAFDILVDTVAAGYVLTPVVGLTAPLWLPEYHERADDLKAHLIDAGGADPDSQAYQDGEDALEAASWAWATTGLARGGIALESRVAGAVAARAFERQTGELVEGGCAVGLSPEANFAQKTAGANFSQAGRFNGAPVDEVVAKLRSGELTRNDVIIETIDRDGTTLILNTRSSQALEKAGIPRSEWMTRDHTGDLEYEKRLSDQLQRNKLTSQGVPAIRDRRPR